MEYMKEEENNEVEDKRNDSSVYLKDTKLLPWK